jgi:hypothetical protein
MIMKRQSLKLDEIDWQILVGIARECGSEYRGEPSWRRLIDDIASGRLTVVNRPNKRFLALQDKLRRPLVQQRQKWSRARFEASIERNRFRHEQKRRAAGISPRGAQAALDGADGVENAFEEFSQWNTPISKASDSEPEAIISPAPAPNYQNPCHKTESAPGSEA